QKTRLATLRMTAEFMKQAAFTMRALDSGDQRAMISKPAKRRCSWATTDPVYIAYHDTEWGVPQHDSRALWEMLMLEGFQAGLSWAIVLRKRAAFRKAFAGFDPDAVARFSRRDVGRLLGNPGIIRARAKIEA